MKKKYRNEEVRNVIAAEMTGILLFYLTEYREDIDKWGEAFKQEFNNIVDNLVGELKEEEE